MKPILAASSTSRAFLSSAGTAALALSVVLAGCSSGGKATPAAPGAPGAPGASATSANTGSSTKLDPSDYVYTQGPETAGFRVDQSVAGDGDPTKHDDALFLDIDDCLGANVGAPSAIATGPEFGSQDGLTTLESTAEIVTPEQRAAHLKELADPRIDDCIKKLMQQGDTTDDDQANVFANLARQNAAVPPGAVARLTFAGAVTGANGTVNFYINVIFLGSGRAESAFTVSSASRPTDEALITAATAQLAAKLKKQ